MADWIPESEEVRQERARRFTPDLDWLHHVTDWWDNLDMETVTKIYLAGVLAVAIVSVLGSGVGKAISFWINHNKEDKHA